MVHSKKNKAGTRKKKPSDPKTKVPVVQEEKQQKITEESADIDQSFEKVSGEVEDYAILILDLQGTILTWNKGAEKIQGYSASEIIGKNYRIFFTKEDKENDLSEKLLTEAKTNGRTNYEGWRVRKDGTRFWGSVTITALHNDDGGIRGFPESNT